jgi:Ohr subfamily peroxiredoxin
MEARRTRNSYLGGGYAACFENALLRVSREAKHHFSDDQVEVVAEIGLSRNEEGSFVLSASLAVTLEGVDQAMGEEFVHRAHKICPYSNAIRGNVDVAISVTIR